MKLRTPESEFEEKNHCFKPHPSALVFDVKQNEKLRSVEQTFSCFPYQEERKGINLNVIESSCLFCA
jgi:hypothetical protein